jgi:hypothetical protein
MVIIAILLHLCYNILVTSKEPLFMRLCASDSHDVAIPLPSFLTSTYRLWGAGTLANANVQLLKRPSYGTMLPPPTSIYALFLT